MKTTDLHTVQFIIAAVAVIAVTSLVLSCYRQNSEAYLALTGSCVTGLFALLAQTRTQGRARDESETKPGEH